MNKVIEGGDLMVFVENESIALATNHTMTISVDTKDKSTKDSGSKWQAFEASVLTWSIKSENLFSVDGKHGIGYDVMFDYMIQRKPVTIVFSLKNVGEAENYNQQMQVPGDGWSPGGAVCINMFGQALITNLEANAPNGDNASFSVDFTGIGPLQNISAVFLDDESETAAIGPENKE